MRKLLFFIFMATMFISSCKKDNVIKGGGNNVDVSDNFNYYKASVYSAVIEDQKDQPFIVVFKDTTELRRFPVADDLNLSTKYDFHYLIGGNVYSQYKTKNQTIISKNGLEIFRYDVVEYVRGIIVGDKGVYTLGQGLRDNCLYLRLNGKEIFKQENGVVIGNNNQCLFFDRGEPCFTFIENLNNDNKKWYVYKNKRAVLVELEDDVLAVHSIRVVDGDIVKLLSLNGKANNPILIQSSGETPLDWNLTDNNYYCNFYNIDKKILIVNRKGKLGFRIWDNVDFSRQYVDNKELIAFTNNKNLYAWIIKGENNLEVNYSNNVLKYIEGAYTVLGDNCFTFMDNRLCIGVSPKGSVGKPFVWIENHILELPVTGRIFAIEYKEEEKEDVTNPPM